MEINTKSFTLIPMLVLLSFFHFSLISCGKNVNSFTLDLIHRDSPLSPFHNPSNTPYERLQNVLYRSFSRASFIKKTYVNPIQSTLIPNGGEYLMKISIGTPPIDNLVIVDTSSDLTWTQCKPCVDCFKQLGPIFNPKNSTSYKTIGCNNKLCQGFICNCYALPISRNDEFNSIVLSSGLHGTSEMQRKETEESPMDSNKGVHARGSWGDLGGIPLEKFKQNLNFFYSFRSNSEGDEKKLAIFAGILSGVWSRSSLEEDAGTGVGYCWYVIVAGFGLLYSLDELELSNNNTCNYEVSYGDQSHTMGDLSIETFTFSSTSGQNVSIPNIVFGCGHDNGGTFTNATSGIIGLGGGNVSIVNQMHQQIIGKFSYCLIPLESLLDNSNATSHINFGNCAIVFIPDVVSTPLIKKEPSTFYYLNLKGINIGNKMVQFKSSPISQPSYDRGNIIIDSGTTLTYVPDVFYLNLESLLMRSINSTRKDGTYGGLDLCYESNENGTIDVPKIVAHFTNADLELSTSNIFTQMEEGIVCLTIVPGGNQISILGNLAQANFLIGYDLKANRVSFKRTDCTKY
ncbi:aspartic proteinase CDR1-like [Solanum stenotomum]|uniref:aspartic proteinase CDR1-like n=1 Tax=Solanum stenotomum TaxID=172797 RepID=UPI0020D193E1|nr:aspartic proteinase CDR1-like [Solanum stenotomum]